MRLNCDLGATSKLNNLFQFQLLEATTIYATRVLFSSLEFEKKNIQKNTIK